MRYSYVKEKLSEECYAKNYINMIKNTLDGLELNMSEILKTYNNSENEFDHSHDKKSQSTYDFMYFFTILYLIIDYGRPQDIIADRFFKTCNDCYPYFNAFCYYKFKISNI